MCQTTGKGPDHVEPCTHPKRSRGRSRDPLHCFIPPGHVPEVSDKRKHVRRRTVDVNRDLKRHSCLPFLGGDGERRPGARNGGLFSGSRGGNGTAAMPSVDWTGRSLGLTAAPSNGRVSSASRCARSAPSATQGASASRSVRHSISSRPSRPRSVALPSASTHPGTRAGPAPRPIPPRSSRDCQRLLRARRRWRRTTPAPRTGPDRPSAAPRRARRRDARSTPIACHSTRCGSSGQGRSAFAAANGHPAVGAASAASRARTAASARAGEPIRSPSSAR